MSPYAFLPVSLTDQVLAHHRLPAAVVCQLALYLKILALWEPQAMPATTQRMKKLPWSLPDQLLANLKIAFTSSMPIFLEMAR